jgi:hypothetical protein
VALKAVYRPADEFMANTVRDLLEQNGIPAITHSFQIPAYDGLALMMRPVWGEVMVEAENAERARELIEGFLASRTDEKSGTTGQDDRGQGEPK